MLLAQINAVFLFPQLVEKPSKFEEMQSNAKIEPSVDQFPESLKLLSESIHRLLGFLSDLPEFEDDALGGALVICAADVEVCLFNTFPFNNILFPVSCRLLRGL